MLKRKEPKAYMQQCCNILYGLDIGQLKSLSLKCRNTFLLLELYRRWCYTILIECAGTLDAEAITVKKISASYNVEKLESKPKQVKMVTTQLWCYCLSILLPELNFPITVSPSIFSEFESKSASFISEILSRIFFSKNRQPDIILCIKIGLLSVARVGGHHYKSR